jgi:raffinose/stachyose/melibiose transport system substrate-binding protein
MNHSKKLILPVLAAVWGVVCAGCAKQQEAMPEADEPVILRVLNYYDISAAGGVRDAAWIWDSFVQANPNITIIREDFINEPFHQRMETYAVTGELPDVIYAWPAERSAILHTQGLLKDLGPLVEKDNLAAEYYPAALDPLGQEMGYLGILPGSVTSSHVFYVNNEVLRDAGLSPAKTYGELKAQVPVLRDKGYDTVIVANQDTWVMQSCLFSLLAGRFCGQGWDRKIRSGEAKFTDSEFEDALSFVQDLYIDGVLTRATLGIDYNSVVRLFAANKAAYFIDQDRQVDALITGLSVGGALIPSKRQSDIGLSIFPDISGVALNRSTSVVLGPGWGMRADIPAGSSREAAAWKLIKWLSGREVQTWLLGTGAVATPSRIDIDVDSLDLEPMQKALARFCGEYTVGTAVIDRVFHSNVYTPINDGLQQIAMGARTPQQTARAAQRALDASRSENPGTMDRHESTDWRQVKIFPLGI